jgi:DNA-binding PadR family transcriptional regulator
MYERSILLGFTRVHILHHASREGGVWGSWMTEELKSHGYDISPGTLYPILHKMEKDGVLRSENVKVSGKIRRIYKTTGKGDDVLERLRSFVKEMSEEVLQ